MLRNQVSYLCEGGGKKRHSLVNVGDLSKAICNKIWFLCGCNLLDQQNYYYLLLF